MLTQTLSFPCNFNCRFRCRAAVKSLSPPTRKSGSLYEVLRVNRNASTVEIKAAYRSLAKLHHPDASLSGSSDGRDFIQIHNAYETLSDPAARAIYDLSNGMGMGMGIGIGVANTNPFSSEYQTVSRRPRQRWETDQCW